MPFGEESAELDALKRIDRTWRNASAAALRRGTNPAEYGFPIPSTSPLGDIVGRGARAIDEAGEMLRGASAWTDPATAGFGAGQGIGRAIESFSAGAGDLAKYLVTPRSPRKAAFVSADADPRITHGNNRPGGPVKDSPPTTSQALDATAPLTGVDSATAPPAATAQAPPRKSGSLMVGMGGGPLKEWDPVTGEDIGAPGRGGFLQPSVEDMPAGQLPDSYFEGLKRQRAIDMAGAAPGALGEAGFTREQALPYLGQEFVSRAATDRQIRTEEAKAQTEAARTQRYAETVNKIRQSRQNAENQIKALPITPEDRDDRLAQAARIEETMIEDARTAAGIGARISSSALYDQGF